jgi:dolichyl-phosphate-mannose-protein mannosyltransferase
MKPALEQDRSRREWLAVAVVTLIGFVLRSWPVGGLGLTHFDEGIYALVASWSLLPRGLAGIDPLLIPYAPPGYPILGGLAYWLLGRSDGAMIAVSQVAGTLTIPVVAWLGRRTFGPGAGFASATFCAFSGPHIAFSRMALTDASFLLAWLLAIGAGMRFLEKPGASRAILMGLAVGLAQEFKYNGWLTGGIVIGSAVWGILIRPEERKLGSIARIFGWGIAAAGVAWLVVWPWFAFVEVHGGYSALLRHQRSYLGGLGDWWPNFLIQAEQAIAMCDLRLIIPSVVLACMTYWIASPPGWLAATAHLSPIRRGFSSVPSTVGVLPCTIAPYVLGLFMVPWFLGRPRSSVRLVAVWWFVLSVMTPFYHPYARLWLPYHAVNWLIMGWLVVDAWGFMLEFLGEPMEPISSKADVVGRILSAFIPLVLLILAFAIARSSLKHQPLFQPGLLDPSDSLYRATVRVSEVLPKEVKGLRLLVRPPVTYYLAGRVALYPVAGLDQLLKPGDPEVWALVDSAILPSEPGVNLEGRNLPDRLAKNWEVVEELPTTPSLPTLLDLDPGAARSTSGPRPYPLWLLRPRTSKAAR